MKITVDIGDNWVADLDQTVAQVIMSDIVSAVQKEIRQAIKEELAKRRDRINAKVRAAFDELKVDIS